MLIFFAGFVTGVCVLLALAIITGPKIQAKDDASLKRVLKDVELMGSVKYRFGKANEITEAQLELVSRAERPSASAAHSRHKNDIIRQLKALEEEKIELFRSILKDGIDPKLSIVIDGKPTTMRMSEAVAIHDKTAPNPVAQTETNIPRTTRLRLAVDNERNKEDEQPESNDTTVH